MNNSYRFSKEKRIYACIKIQNLYCAIMEFGVESSHEWNTFGQELFSHVWTEKYILN